MKSKRIERVKDALFAQVCRACLILRGKVAEVFCFSVVFYGRPKAVAVWNYAKYAAFAVNPCAAKILLIFRGVRLAKIFNSIVRAVTVDMVHLMRRIFTGHVKPRKPVSFVRVAINFDDSIAVTKTSSNIALFDLAPARRIEPRKNAGFWIVVEKLADALCGKIGLSHAVSPVKKWFGQRPVSVCALDRLRYFSVGGA